MLPFAICRLTIGVTTKKKTRCIGYTRIGHRTGRRVFFERIETDDVTTVLTWREDSEGLICLCPSPPRAKANKAKETKKEKEKKNGKRRTEKENEPRRARSH